MDSVHLGLCTAHTYASIKLRPLMLLGGLPRGARCVIVGVFAAHAQLQVHASSRFFIALRKTLSIRRGGITILLGSSKSLKTFSENAQWLALVLVQPL